MIDRNAVRVRFWIRVLSLPRVWLPAASGICLMLSGYGMSMVGIGLLASASVLGYALWRTYDEYWTAAETDIRLADQYFHHARLRELRRLLRQDKDHRSSQCIRDLQFAYDRIQRHNLLERNYEDGKVTAEVKEHSYELYQATVDSLERTYQMWQAAKEMTTETTSEQLLRSREELLEDVGRSIVNIGHSLDFLHALKLQVKSIDDKAADAARKELEQGLEIARSIHKRLEDLETETKTPDYSVEKS